MNGSVGVVGRGSFKCRSHSDLSFRVGVDVTLETVGRSGAKYKIVQSFRGGESIANGNQQRRLGKSGEARLRWQDGVSKSVLVEFIASDGVCNRVESLCPNLYRHMGHHSNVDHASQNRCLVHERLVCRRVWIIRNAKNSNELQNQDRVVNLLIMPFDTPMTQRNFANFGLGEQKLRQPLDKTAFAEQILKREVH